MTLLLGNKQYPGSTYGKEYNGIDQCDNTADFVDLSGFNVATTYIDNIG